MFVTEKGAIAKKGAIAIEKSRVAIFVFIQNRLIVKLCYDLFRQMIMG